MPPKASATLTINVPLDEAWPVIVDIMRNAKARALTVDDANHVIEAKAGTSIFSWGENVTVEARSYGPTQTEVTISSASSFKLTLIDYGKNKGNVEQLTNRLRERLPVTTPA
ncbi:MAG: hypothetical protein AB7T32_10640 [Dehalococcoidia bacterium]